MLRRDRRGGDLRHPLRARPAPIAALALLALVAAHAPARAAGTPSGKPPAAAGSAPAAAPAPPAVAVNGPVDEAAMARLAAACKDAAKVAQRRNIGTHVGGDGFLFYAPDLLDLQLPEFWGPAARKVSRALSPQHADPLPAILDFAAQLERLGIELLLVPTPTKPTILYDKLGLPVAPPVPAPDSGSPYRFDTHAARFYALLREKGVNVLDTWPIWMGQHAKAEPVFCRQDMHPAGAAYVRLAEEIVQRLGEKPWMAAAKAAGPGPLETEWRSLQISGDLWKVLPAPRPPRETVSVRHVGRRVDGALLPLPEDPMSPILLLGDSNTLIWHAGGDLHTVGAGLADQLAYLLGFPVDVIGVRGSGATPARLNLYRKARKVPGYLASKKLVIWVFSAREFTETQGWNPVQLPGAGAK